MVRWYLRPSNLVAVARGTSYLFVVPGQPPAVLDDTDIDAVSRVLAMAAMPIRHADLATAADDEAIATLVELGVLEVGTEPSLSGRGPTRAAVEQKRCKNVVAALSGAVHVASSISHVTAIQDLFADEVEVVISEGAQHFIQPRLFEYYGFRTWLDPFDPMHGAAVPHEHLAMRADLVLVAPASASTIRRLATGECSDLTSLIVAATKAPVVVAPSMNPQMWLYPPIARNVAQLREDGIWVIEPGLGFLVAQRDQGGVGGAALDRHGLLRALDAILTQSAGG